MFKSPDNKDNKDKKDNRLSDEMYKYLDFWSLGCVLYQLNTGKVLFEPFIWLIDDHEKRVESIDYPENMNAATKDLISKLLVLEPSNRLGGKDINNLKNHKFFQSINWDTLQAIVPPYFNEKHKKCTCSE